MSDIAYSDSRVTGLALALAVGGTILYMGTSFLTSIAVGRHQIQLSENPRTVVGVRPGGSDEPAHEWERDPDLGVYRFKE